MRGNPRGDPWQNPQGDPWGNPHGAATEAEWGNSRGNPRAAATEAELEEMKYWTLQRRRKKALHHQSEVRQGNWGKERWKEGEEEDGGRRMGAEGKKLNLSVFKSNRIKALTVSKMALLYKNKSNKILICMTHFEQAYNDIRNFFFLDELERTCCLIVYIIKLKFLEKVNL